ncbi:MAG: lipopolysaccharide heptosyltransferase II [Verrucomicrobia bacterium]|nr:lipopolysaccharide heptosyltransferase II [Verrucomicrobiota bacterium]
MKILILKPSSLGDVIQALPVLRLLKLWQPASEIYWWIAADLRGLLEGDPDLQGVLPFERKKWASPRHWHELLASVRRMRALGFDWVIDLQSLARSGAFAWLANGRFTVGLDDSREGARGFYDCVVPRPTFHTHAVDWYLSALELLGVPVRWDFEWLPPRPVVAAAVREKWQTGAARWVVLQPGARWLNKRWPAEHFAELVRRMATEHDAVRFAILGGAEEAALGDAIAQAAPRRCLNLAGKTSLPEMIEWIRLSDLMVTNDTGPMHVAAALGKPLVAVFGPTEPRRTGPYGHLERVLQLPLPCVPCMTDRCHYAKPRECLRAITPEMVVERVREALREKGG